MSVALQDNFAVGSPKPIDSRYGFNNLTDGTYRLFNTTSEVLGSTGIPVAFRYQGLTVGIRDNTGKAEEWWFRDDIYTLVKKISSSGAATVSASNGLSIAGNGDVILGGPLTQATTITTSSTNTLSITGLQNPGIGSIYTGLGIDSTTGQLYSVNSILPSTSIGGTPNYIAKFTSPFSIGDSQMYDNGINVGLGTASPTAKFHVVGGVRAVNAAASALYATGGTELNLPSTAVKFKITGPGFLETTQTKVLGYNTSTGEVTYQNPPTGGAGLQYYGFFARIGATVGFPTTATLIVSYNTTIGTATGTSVSGSEITLANIGTYYITVDATWASTYIQDTITYGIQEYNTSTSSWDLVPGSTNISQAGGSGGSYGVISLAMGYNTTTSNKKIRFFISVPSDYTSSQRELYDIRVSVLCIKS